MAPSRVATPRASAWWPHGSSGRRAPSLGLGSHGSYAATMEWMAGVHAELGRLGVAGVPPPPTADDMLEAMDPLTFERWVHDGDGEFPQWTAVLQDWLRGARDALEGADGGTNDF